MVSTVGPMPLRVLEHTRASARSRRADRARDASGGAPSRRSARTPRRPSPTTVSTSAQHALEIRRERFHRGAGMRSLDRAHAGGVMRGATVGKIVAIDRGEHDVLEAHEPDACARRSPAPRASSQPCGLPVSTAQKRQARVHTAPITMMRRRARVPALADVGTLRFLADGAQSVLAHDARTASNAAPLAQRRLAASGGLPPSAGRSTPPWRLHTVLDRGETLRGAVFFAAAHGRRGAWNDRDSLEFAHRNDSTGSRPFTRR